MERICTVIFPSYLSFIALHFPCTLLNLLIIQTFYVQLSNNGAGFVLFFDVLIVVVYPDIYTLC